MFLLLLICFCWTIAAELSAIDNVNMYIGTGGQGFGYGGTDMAAQVPFGAWRGGPDTSYIADVWVNFDHTSGYHYGDNHIRAFSHTRLVGAGVPDYGNVGIMALQSLDNKTIVKNGYRSLFSSDDETAMPGYYKVKLKTHDVTAELTAAGTHAGLHRYHYDSMCKERVLLLDVCHNSHRSDPEKACKNATIEISEDGIITGSVLMSGSLSGRSPIGGVMIYFWVNVTNDDSSAVPSMGVWTDHVAHDNVASGSSTQGSLGAYFRYPPSKTADGGSCGELELQVGISFVSIDQAKLNAHTQIEGRTFDEVKTDTLALWDKEISRLSVDASAPAEIKTKVYTAYYHTLVAPTQATEENGVFMGFDTLAHQEASPSAKLYTDMSLWDTFRTQTPFLSLIKPSVAQDIIRSFVMAVKYGGDIPKWPLADVYTGCMTGQHSFVVIADAVTKGIVSLDEVVPLMDAMVREATTGSAQHSGRSNVQVYTEKGYIPSDVQDAGASRTLEYAYDDWALSVVAEALGHNDTAAAALRRSKNYKNVWDAEHQFMCPRDSNGTLHCKHEAEYYFLNHDYTEGNAWQWTWFVPHDPLGLIALFDSKDAYVSKLDQCFARSTLHRSNLLPNPYYWAGNEPDLLHVWMFVFANRADLTQKWSRWLVNNKYNAQANGIPGNDDYGTMSAWLFFASAGFYPLSGFPFYLLGSPAVPALNLTLETGSTIQMIAHNWSEDTLYVGGVKVNSVALDGPVIHHHQLAADCVLEFEMSKTPTTWGANFDWRSVTNLWP